LLFVQDTLKAPPAENKSMKRAALIAILTTTGFYMSVGCAGYAAFGNASQGNLLTGFGFYNPYWLVDFANACVVVHLIGAYQVGLAFCVSPLSYKSILNTHKRIQFGRLVAFLGVCVCN
jgi:amino acid permease